MVTLFKKTESQSSERVQYTSPVEGRFLGLAGYGFEIIVNIQIMEIHQSEA